MPPRDLITAPALTTFAADDGGSDGSLLDFGLRGHISIADLHALQLQGLQMNRRNLTKRAEREGWSFIDRVGRGGGRLYAIADLPASARMDLVKRRRAAIEAEAPARGRPAGSGYLARYPEYVEAITSWLAERRQSSRAIHAKLLVTFFDQDVPSRRTVQRMVALIEHQRKVELESYRNPDAFKSRHRVSLGTVDGNITFANEVWELDTTPVDVATIGGRKAILGLIDRYSRRANFMVAESESGQSVRRFLIETIRSWGVMPRAVMTDNGSGYINASIVSALEALGIEHRICPPGSPEKKPYIERLFGTFTRERAELLEGYSGHNVADAQALRARARKETGRAVIEAKITPDQLQVILSNWLDGVYHLREHGTTRQAPLARWYGCPHPQIAAPDDEVLKLALTALVGIRRVGKRGVVWERGRYWSPSLVAWMGKDVIVRRDEDDLGRLMIFALDNQFIDIAVDHTRAGLSEEAFARAALAHQQEFMRGQRADIRQMQRKFDPSVAREKLLLKDAEDAGKVAWFPVRGTVASTPMLDSLAEAVAADRGTAPTPADSAPPAPTTATVLPAAFTPEQRMRDADALIARAEAGEEVDQAALRRARNYQTTSEYRAQRAVADHWGQFASPNDRQRSATPDRSA